VKALGSGAESCELGIEGNRFGVRAGNVEVFTQQIEGSFPNFAALLENALSHKVTLDQDELHSAIRKASLFAGSDVRVVRFRLEPGNLNVNSNVAEFGDAQTDLAVEYDGEPVELGFNPDYLTDLLKVVGSGLVELEFETEKIASRWRPNEHFVYLVMPVVR
jgi:DNA polymerase-3 subunit beta